MSKRIRDKKKIAYTNTKKWVEESDKGFVPTLYKLPKGVKSYRFKPKSNPLDFMPYVCGPSNPNAKEGKVHWECTVYAHAIPTPSGLRRYACTQNPRNKPQGEDRHKCGICQGLAKLRQQGELDEDTIAKMEAYPRRLFCVVNTKSRKDGYHILETGHYRSFGMMLKDELDELDEDSPKLDFFHLQGGMTLDISCKNDSFKSGNTDVPFVGPRKITFEPRKEEYEENVLEEIPCLDQLIIWPTEEEGKKLFGDSEYGSSPKKKKKERDDDEEEEEDDEVDDEDEEEDEPKSKKNKKREEDEEDDDSDDGDDSELDEEDDEGSDDEEEDSDEDEEDEEGLRKGMKVKFTDENGKKGKGLIKSINEKTGIVLVMPKGQDKSVAVDKDDCFSLGESA